jgi:hypothetical protein
MLISVSLAKIELHRKTLEMCRAIHYNIPRSVCFGAVRRVFFRPKLYIAAIAQQVEHIHGKDGVIGSSPISGSKSRVNAGFFYKLTYLFAVFRQVRRHKDRNSKASRNHISKPPAIS